MVVAENGFLVVKASGAGVEKEFVTLSAFDACVVRTSDDFDEVLGLNFCVVAVISVLRRAGSCETIAFKSDLGIKNEVSGFDVVFKSAVVGANVESVIFTPVTFLTVGVVVFTTFCPLFSTAVSSSI